MTPDPRTTALARHLQAAGVPERSALMIAQARAVQLNWHPADLKQLRRQDRPLRPWEQLAQLDRIEAVLDRAREQFQAAGAQHVHKLAVQAAGQAGKRRQPSLPTGDLEVALQTELESLYATGQDTVAAELAAQSDTQPPDGQVQLAAKPPAGDDGKLTARARLAAQAIAARITDAVQRAILAASPATPPTPAVLQAAGELAGMQGLRAEAVQHASAALNLGRQAQARDQADQIEGARYTSILDGARCDACAEADDDVLRPLGDPVREDRMPPNSDCEGGDRCRCIEVYELASEAAPRA